MKIEYIVKLSEKAQLTYEDIRPLIDCPVSELIFAADKVRKKFCNSKFDLCSITNAKSGLCSENCKFCAQSSRHRAEASVYPLKQKAELLEDARRAKDTGAERFGIVTSGKTLGRSELSTVAETINEIKEKIKIEVCCSLGSLSFEELSVLKESGLTRYHHNIETSRRYFPEITTTHSIQDRINTIKQAKSLNLEVCSGGIIGMGENWQDRVDMALLLSELNVDSVPINMLVPIKGTPLESLKSISPADAIRTICIFRIILKNKTIKIAAGRESILKDFQTTAFLGGANGMLIGGYLTICGRDVGEDREMVKEILKAWSG
jgi:biotin synthase